MDFSAAVKLLLVFLCFSFVTNLVCSYFVVGILSCKYVAIASGVLLLLIAGYIGFFIFKAEKTPIKIGLFGATAVFTLAASIACFAKTKLIMDYNSPSTFFLAFFIALGLFEVLAFLWPQLLLQLFSTFVQAFDVGFLHMVSAGLGVAFSLVCALFMLVPSKANENLFVQKASVITIATIVVNSVIGSLTGFLLQLKAESGYTNQI